MSTQKKKSRSTRRNRLIVLVAIVMAAIFASSACTQEEQFLFVAAKNAQREATLASVKTKSGLTDEQLARLAKCESTNNPKAVSKSGTYHGLYQFNQTTWNSTAKSVLPEYVGVSPSAAPSEIQDAMARALYASRGRSPWPVCGRRI